MKKILLILISLFLISAIPVTAFAHSGRTDAKGGHYDYEENEYHYHHGYPAHQHPNGVCPYRNVEKQEEKELGFFGTFFKALSCLFVGALGAMMVIVCISYVVILILAFTGIYDKIGSDKIFDVGLKIIFILWILLSLFFAWRIYF